MCVILIECLCKTAAPENYKGDIMNYNSTIRLRDPNEYRNKKAPPLSRVSGRVDRIVKYYRGYFGITNKTSARRWLNDR